MPNSIKLPLYGVQTITPTSDESYFYSFSKGTNLATNSTVYILVDGSNYVGVNPITIIIPRISEFSLTWGITINIVDVSKTSSVNNIVVIPSGSDNINGDPNWTLDRDGNTLSLMIASQNLWYCEDTSGGGGSPTGVNLELNNSPLAGGPFSTLDFLPSGLTGMSLQNLGGGTAGINIVTAALTKIYYADFLNLVSAGTLTIGASYWIVDVGDGQNDEGGLYPADCSSAYYAQPYPSPAFQAFAHNAGIILRAISNNSCDVNGIFLGRTVKRPSVSLFQQNIVPYNLGDIVENYNMVFEKTGGANGITYNVEAADSTDWTFIPKDNNTYYELDIQGCIYDYNTNIIVKRWDKYGNTLQNVTSTFLLTNNSNNFIKKCFRWSYSGYVGNTIFFDDDSSKSPTLMAPIFNLNLINYSNALLFNHNTIDANVVTSLVPPTPNTQFTRYWNNQFYASEFSGNTVDGAIVSNIVDGGNNYFITNNVIKNSAVNNCYFNLFSNNTIVNNSMVGDLGGLFVGTGTVNLYDLNLIPNICIINNVGSKQWNTVTAGATLSSVTLPSTIDFGTAIFTPTLRPNDYIYFSSGPTVELQGTLRKVLSNSSNTVFDLVDTLTTPAINQACTAICFPPSVPTKFSNFIDNEIDSTTVRGMNKIINVPTFFTRNTLKSCFIENYVPHPQPPQGPFIFNYYDGSTTVPPESEFGFSFNTKGGFTNNKCEDLILSNNRIGEFSSNNITGAYIYDNAPNLNTFGFVGSQPCTLEGLFAGNKLQGNASTNTNGVNEFFSGAWNAQRLPYTPSIYIFNNRITGFVQYNTFNDGSALRWCNIAGTLVGNKSLGSAGGLTTLAGLTGFIETLINASVTVQGITLEGRSTLQGISFANALQKEIGNNGPTNINNILFRDAQITNISYPATIPLTPNLFASQNNPIRDITIDAEVPAGTVALGTPPKNYAIADYNVTITTQQPHLLNNSMIGISGQPISIEGLQLLTVSQTTGVPPQSFFSYLNYNPVLVTAFSDFAPLQMTIDNIIDDYTFEATFAAASFGGNGFLLATSNATSADIVNPIPSRSTGSTAPPAAAGVQYYPNSFTAANGACFNDDARDTYTSLLSLYPTRMETASGQGSVFGTDVSLPNSNAKIKLSLTLPAGPPPPYPLIGSVGSRSYYHFVNYVSNTTPYYNSGTGQLILPVYLDQMNITIILGGISSGIYNIDTITNLTNAVPNGTRVTLLTTYDITIQINLVSPTGANTNEIVGPIATTPNIQLNASYIGVGSSVRSISDVIVLERMNSVWNVVEKTINF